jgi:hypothetical protein
MTPIFHKRYIAPSIDAKKHIVAINKYSKILSEWKNLWAETIKDKQFPTTPKIIVVKPIIKSILLIGFSIDISFQFDGASRIRTGLLAHDYQ